jgi:multicomponent Na+:H+ antiporter subunit D
MTTDVPHSALALVAILLQVLGGLLAIPLGRFGHAPRLWILGVLCALTTVLVAATLPGAAAGEVDSLRFLQLTQQAWLELRVEAMGALFAVTASVLCLLSFLYSVGHLRRDPRPGRYYAFFMLCQAALLAVAFAGNLVTLFVFYELLSILAYPLVVHEQTARAVRAGVKYIVYILLGGSLLLAGVLLTFFLAGDQPFRPGGILEVGMGRSMLLAAFACFVGGFGVKAALVPLHGWVPDVHPAAPAPFSALLSGVLVAAGAFGILRTVFEVFGVALLEHLGVMAWLTGLAAFSVLFAAVVAVGEDDLKRRLAWSTISQMAYVLLAVSLLAAEATVGALVHISHHAFLKGGLFFCAGMLASEAGIRKVSELDGAARRMPLTMAAFAVAAFGMVGVPPLSGFISKWLLGAGMLEAGQPLALVILLGGALLAALYLWPVVYAAYFRPSAAKPAGPPERQAPLSMRVAVVSAAAISVLLGLLAWLPGLPVALARAAVAAFFGGR